MYLNDFSLSAVQMHSILALKGNCYMMQGVKSY